MIKLLVIQLGLVTAGIICIFICFFLTIAEYQEPLTGFYIQIYFNTEMVLKDKNGITVDNAFADCSIKEDSQSSLECQSWEWNYAMGCLVIACGCFTLMIIILREFYLSELMTQYGKQVRFITYSISALSIIFAIVGVIWLVSCQSNYVLELSPILLMIMAGILIVLGGIAMENQIRSKRQIVLIE